MKKTIFFPLVLLMVSAASFSQQTNPSPALNKQYYLEKSKRQKAGGNVMLIGGAVLIGTGFLIGGGKESTLDDLGDAFTGGIIGGTGVVLMLGSIPVFIASGKNKRRAMSISLNMQQVPQLQNNSFLTQAMPSIGIKISL